MTDNAQENVGVFGKFPIHETRPDSSDDEDEEENNEDDDIHWEDYREYNEDEIQMESTESMEAECDAIYEDICDWSKETLIRLGCVTHALQLVIKECLKKNPRSQEIISYINKLTAFFSMSTYWHSQLVEMTKKGIIKIGDTRWNGLLFALKRLLEVLNIFC
ncbi:unnamed protein product [Allacma fusca]|uniref:Uncharacterized protein n=1 Tax=Allacma fusca TaxID=39272 RepID=A0A8J2PTQ1_9HEXA|nr:unnamed protein product [Allacma fusca]